MDPAAISTGMGEGEAQVFKPQEDFLGEAMKAAETKKKESAANKAQAMATLNKMAEYHVWTQRDGAEFAKLQKGVWDGLAGKDLDDPATMLWLNQKQQELTYKADKSNTDKEAFVNATKDLAANPTKYFKDTGEYLIDYADPKKAFGDFDITKIQQKPDVQAFILKAQAEGKAEALANKKETATVGTLPGGGEQKFKIETSTTTHPLEKAIGTFRTYMAEPSNLKAVQEMYEAEDPKHEKYTDVYDYADKNIAPHIASSSTDVDASQITGGSGFGSGGGGFTPGGWGAEETKTEASVLNEQGIQQVVQGRIADPSAKKNYDYLIEQDKIPYITKDGKQRQMTFDEFEEDLVRKSPTAQRKEVAAVYNFGRASKTGEATEIRYMEITSGNKKGVQFKPTQIIIKKGKEPIFSGLDPNDNKIEIPYSELSGKLRVETGGDWDLLKEKIAKEQGFDAFAPYEPKKPSGSATTGGAKPTTNAKRDASSNTYSSGTQPIAPIQGKATGSALKDYAPDAQQRIKAVMAANNIDETTAINALKKAGKLK
tara:strand:- start:6625 stop:8250 length:1626 start_codon:yes stop_codon:yes gene_type:complete